MQGFRGLGGLTFGVDPGKKSIYFLGISSCNRNPKPKKVLKYSTPKPRGCRAQGILGGLELEILGSSGPGRGSHPAKNCSGLGFRVSGFGFKDMLNPNLNSEFTILGQLNGPVIWALKKVPLIYP